MCYTVNAKATIEGLNKRFSAKNNTPELHKTYNKLSGFNAVATPITDYSKLPVLTSNHNSVFTYMQWGLIPSWTKQEDAKQFVMNNLNAKAETIFEKRSFEPSLKSQRCIIPITGFFENREISKEKYPYFISIKGEPIFSLAGIYDVWEDEISETTIQSFSIITTQANPLMEKIHNTKKRMPVILTKENERHWIEAKLSDIDIRHLLQPIDDSIMQAHTISKRINNNRINSDVENITAEVEYPELLMFE